MNAVGRRYCPVGTRDVLHEEIKNLRKRRNMSVEEYDAQFQQLLRLESWLPPRDGVPMTEEDQCRHYSAGMPRTWQVAVVPQQSRWSDLRRLKTHYMQAERVEQQGGKEINRKSKGKRDQHHHSDGKKGKNKQSDEKKRKRNTQEGCKFCRANGNVWNNHGDDECFRNPKSQSYRPRSGRNKQDSTSAKRTEPRSTGPHQAAAMKSETRTTNDPDLLSYWQTEHGEQGAAMRAVGDGVLEKTLPALVVKVTLKHALNKQTYTALLDTGATSSLVRQEVASWYKPQKETTWYRNVNNELQPAKGAIELPFVLPGFSDKRLCVQTCKLVEQLLYPLILGTDFLQQQGVVIDYQTREIRWDGLTMTMQTAPTEREKYNSKQVHFGFFIQKPH
ncbi:hypothetical protein PHMEG_0005649 [Phytophthora megakarya]|uniref:Retropepsins domain-containing protein n=1 Tax=Phytophthora megakarya TaxID=4795 RepID=A0A225WSP5_9STRA|nr:hypothetical protein PHMEG_0005649 [Phytophthora megakarya]